MTYLGAAPTTTASRKSQTTYRYLCTAGQTVFSGADLNNNTLSCDPLDTEVFMNGLKLDSTDTTITTTQVTLAVAAAAGDELEVVAFRTFETADHYTKSDADTRYVNATGDTMTGALTVDTSTTTNLTVDSGNYGGIQFKAAGTDTGYITSYTNGSGAEAMYIGGADTVNIHTGTNHGLTNGTTRLQIDGSGRVTMPYQPSFYAYFTSATQFSASGSTIKLTNFSEYNDTGSCWDQTNQRFTAPVAGKYYFALTGSYTYSSGYFFPKLTVNGSSSAVAGAYHYPMQTSSYIPYTITLVIALSANDYVEVKMDTNYGVTLYNTNFSGFLIG